MHARRRTRRRSTPRRRPAASPMPVELADPPRQPCGQCAGARGADDLVALHVITSRRRRTSSSAIRSGFRTNIRVSSYRSSRSVSSYLREHHDAGSDLDGRLDDVEVGVVAEQQVEHHDVGAGGRRSGPTAPAAAVGEAHPSWPVRRRDRLDHGAEEQRPRRRRRSSSSGCLSVAAWGFMLSRPGGRCGRPRWRRRRRTTRRR